MYEKKIKKLLAFSAASIGSTVLFVPSFMNQGPNIFNIYGGFFSVVVGGYALSQALVLKHFDNRAIEAKNTDLYLEYNALYDEYVEDIASFFKDLGLRGDFSSYVPFVKALHLGYFSKNNSYHYFPSANGIDYFPELLGARVSTGECCCRHNASLYSDVVNKMGGTASVLAVNSKKNKKIVLEPNHMVTGIVHNENKLVLDPTVSPGSIFSTGIYFFDDDKSEKNTILLNSVDKDKTLLKMDSVFEYVENEEKFLEMMECTSMQGLSQLFGEALDGIVVANSHDDDFLCFYNDEETKINQLANLTERLMPSKKMVKK